MGSAPPKQSFPRLLGTRRAQAVLALVLIAALAVGGVFVARGTHATPPTVCPSGCSFTSISAAVAAAAPNAVVTVGAGTYGPGTGDSQIILTQGITLQGIGNPVIDETTVSETQGPSAPIAEAPRVRRPQATSPSRASRSTTAAAPVPRRRSTSRSS